MSNLEATGLIPTIRECIAKGTPLLGICIGEQILFEGSEESPEAKGLGIFKGMVRRIQAPGLKVPHMGWNSLKYPNEGRLFRGIPEDSYVYFVHSYYLEAADPSIVTATTEYGTQIHASVEKGNIFACQFHPEKSSRVGLRILQNFVEITHEFREHNTQGGRYYAYQESNSLPGC